MIHTKPGGCSGFREIASSKNVSKDRTFAKVKRNAMERIRSVSKFFKRIAISSIICSSAILLGSSSGGTSQNVADPFLVGFEEMKDWDYSDTTRVGKGRIERLNILKKEDVPFFMKVIDLKTPYKWMLIPVDGFYWDSAGTVADSVLRVVGYDIAVFYDEFKVPRRRGVHRTIGYVLIDNLNKPVPDTETLVDEYFHMKGIIDIFKEEGIPESVYRDLLEDIERLKGLIEKRGVSLTEYARRTRKKRRQKISGAKTGTHASKKQGTHQEEKSSVFVIDTTEVKPPNYTDIEPSTKTPPRFRRMEPLSERYVVPCARRNNLRLQVSLGTSPSTDRYQFYTYISVKKFHFGGGIIYDNCPNYRVVFGYGEPFSVKLGVRGRFSDAKDAKTVIGGGSKVFLINTVELGIGYNVSSGDWSAEVVSVLLNDLENKPSYEWYVSIIKNRFGGYIVVEPTGVKEVGVVYYLIKPKVCR